MIIRALRLILRALGNITPLHSLRILFWRLSGIRIGKNTFMNMGVAFVDNYRKGAIIIGDRVAMAPHVILIADSDPNRSRLNAIPSFHVRGQVVIGDDTWIGAGTILLPNVHIGKCAVVGAGAVVTHDVEDYSIVAGNPARKIGDVRLKTPQEKL